MSEDKSKKCSCVFDDKGEIVEVCKLHRKWLKEKLTEAKLIKGGY